MDKQPLIDQLNRLLAMELEGVNRYLHHSFMVFGWGREPIVEYFRRNATEGLQHATLLGEKIVSLGGHPQVAVNSSWEPETHDVESMLRINLDAERKAVEGYLALLALIPEDQVALEEMVRGMVREEQEHVDELEKYVRRPGSG